MLASGASAYHVGFPRMVIVPLRSSAYRIGNLRPCLRIGRGETACLHCKIDIGP